MKVKVMAFLKENQAFFHFRCFYMNPFVISNEMATRKKRCESAAFGKCFEDGNVASLQSAIIP